MHQVDILRFRKAVGGDVDATRKLVEDLSPRAHALAWRILGESAEAEDIVQIAFLKLFTSPQYDGKSALSTYLHTIVARLCFDKLRAAHTTSLDYGYEWEESMSDDQLSPMELLERKQSGSKIQHAMMFLSPRQRAALALWAYEDATVAEIAALTGIESNAANQLLHRAKVNLRKIMKELGYE